MPLAVAAPGDNAEQFLFLNLAKPDFQLNLSADLWNMDADSECPVIVGRDVISPGTMQSESGRWPVGTALPTGAPATCAEPTAMFGTRAIRHADYFGNNYGHTSSRLTLTSPHAPFGVTWPAEVVNGFIVRNEGERNGPSEISVITGRSFGSATNDTIVWSPPFSSDPAPGDTFYIIYAPKFDKRGIWIMNGRKFWLLQNATLTLYLDLGVDALLGLVWRGAQIGKGRFMFVTPTQVPRVIDLSSGPILDTDPFLLSYPGILPPGKASPAGLDNSKDFNRGLYAELQGISSAISQAALSQGELTRIRVRGINRDRNEYSEFVPVKNVSAPYLDATSDFFAFNTWFRFSGAEIDGEGNLVSSALAFMCYQYRDGDKVIIDGPESHKNIYDLAAPVAPVTVQSYEYTPQKTIVYNQGSEVAPFLKIPVVNPDFVLDAVAGVSGRIVTRQDELNRARIGVFTSPTGLLLPIDPRWTHLEIWRTTTLGVTYYLERTIEVAALFDPEDIVDPDAHQNRPFWSFVRRDPGNRWTCEMSDEELLGQQQAVTNDLIGGRLPPVCREVASLEGVTVCGGVADVDNPAVTAKASSFYIYGGAYTGTERVRGRVGGESFKWYVFQTGDQFVVSAPASHAGTYTVTSRVDDNNITVPGVPGGIVPIGQLFGYIVRAHTTPWPKLDDEEIVATSRPDIFAPESFITTQVRLSNSGDRLSRFASAGNQLAVVMVEGVHLLRNEGGVIVKETVSAAASGTPWPDSVCVIENSVIWASPLGARILNVFNEANVNGQRGEVIWLDKENRTREWFTQSSRLGYNISAGVDAINQCVRFRRTDGINFYEALQFSFRTGLWTILEDDSGEWYCRAAGVFDTTNPARPLFSVTPEGNAFEVNQGRDEFPFPTATVQDVLGTGFTVTDASITKTGWFDPAMVGGVIRIVSSDPDRDGARRVIRTATADAITFDAITGLADGDEYMIEAIRFAVRTAPMQLMTQKAVRDNVKTIHAIRVRAMPGARGDDPAAGKITLRSYRNYDSQPIGAGTQEIPIFTEAAADQFVSTDYVSALEGDGQAVQVEIEHLHTRSDVKLANVGLVLREEMQIGEDDER